MLKPGKIRIFNPTRTTALVMMLGALWLTGCQKAPVTSFTVDQEEGTSPLTVNFTNTSTDAVRYEWMFGDGATSEEMNPSHTFEYNPSKFKERFNVQLTAFGKGGESNSFSTVIIAKKIVQTNNPKVTDLDIMVDTTVMHYFEEPFICGLSMAIIDGSETHIYHYGETVHGNVTMPNDAISYGMASITKLFAGISLIYWLNQEDISLDAPVKDYLPEDLAPWMSKNGVDITFRHLLTHTSGLKNPVISDPDADFDSTAMFDFIKQGVIIRTPGISPENVEAFFESYYSTVGFGLLGIILERQIGKSLAEIMEETILFPWEMNKTTLRTVSSNSDLSAHPYNDAMPDLTYNYHIQSAFFGGTGLKSNLADLTKFTQKLFTVDESTELGRAVIQSFSEQFEMGIPNFPEMKYIQCLPWQCYIFKDNIEKIIGHSGNSTGYTADFSVSMKNKKAIIILSNNNRNDNAFYDIFRKLNTEFWTSSNK